MLPVGLDGPVIARERAFDLAEHRVKHLVVFPQLGSVDVGLVKYELNFLRVLRPEEHLVEGRKIRGERVRFHAV